MFSTSDEAMEGTGETVSFAQARHEMRCHGFIAREAYGHPGYFLTQERDGQPTELVALNSKAILEWLGY